MAINGKIISKKMNSRNSGKEEPRSHFKYCSVQSRCWVATSKQTIKQYSLLGNRFLISKYRLPLLGNAFVNKYEPMEIIEQQQLNNKSYVFYVVRAEEL
jgi:hypothetical protein